MKKKLAILAAAAAMATMSLAAGPASADTWFEDRLEKRADRIEDRLDNHGFGVFGEDDILFYGGGLVYYDVCEGPVCWMD